MPKSKSIVRIRKQNAEKMNKIIRKKKTTGLEEACQSSLLTLQPNENDYRTQEHLIADDAHDELPVQSVIEVCQDSNDESIAMDDQQIEETADKDDEELHITEEKEKDSEGKLIGRRVIAVTHFFSKLQEIANHGPLGCNINELKLISETQNGLQSKFTFKCSLCNIRFVIDGDNCPDNYLDLNKCAVAGTVAIGCGYSQLEELLSAMNLPILSEKTYNESHDIISKKWEDVLLESMNVAAEEERRLAIEENRVNKDGIPIIDVIIDGCWSKCSYKRNYNAPSGAAAIIGKRTVKILFLGIKNKYCSICALAQKNNAKARKHRCFKNYTGPSTKMESEILVEGFNFNMLA